MATINNDRRDMHEDIKSISGNVFTNDKPELAFPDLHVVDGTLSNDGVGQYGTLTLDENGNYVYTQTKDMNYLGEGVDVSDTFTFTEEYYDNSGQLQTIDRSIRIDIHGDNDQPKISDITASTYEGGDHAGNVQIFQGQFQLEDIDPNTPGVQTDVDDGDTHTFQQVGNVVVESNDVDKALLTGVTVNVDPNTGVYTVSGDFDALSEGDTATVTFQYQTIDTSTSGATTPSDPKTVTLTVIGKNDSVIIANDTITTYDQLIDGDIYKSILANDGHGANDIDVNDKLSIVSTGYHDLQFWKDGGTITVDNAAQTLEYTPGSGGAIAKDHFSFYYQATDNYTDPIGNALAEFNMVNKDGEEIDFYQFGDAGDNKINGIAGKNNVISGMKGNDKLYGKEKGDILYGGDGDDYLEGGWGNDIYVAGKGNDGMVDTRGNDMYVFHKGDGYNTVDDMNLEIYTDAAGHETINHDGFDGQGNDISKDIIYFDATVTESEVAIFQEAGTQYDSLKIKYSKNADDKVSVGYNTEKHYGVEYIAFDGADLNNLPSATTVQDDDHVLTKAEIDLIVQHIATADIDPNTAGVQTAQSVQDVQDSQALMAYIAQYV